MDSQVLPLFLTLALPLPPFFFIYPEITFPAEPVMKINNLSRPKVPAPPPLQNQMVVPYLI